MSRRKTRRQSGRRLPPRRRLRAPALGWDGSGAAVWEWDTLRDEVQVSDLLLEMTGYTRQEFDTDTGSKLELIHPDDRDRVIRAFQDRVAQGDDQLLVEMRVCCRDGQYRWFEVRAVVTRDQAGRPLRLAGAFSDVTDLRVAEEERDRLFNLSVDLLSIIGFDGYLQQLNPAWVRVLGWSRDELMSQPVVSFIHADETGVAKRAVGRLNRGERLQDLEVRFRCRDGSYRWLSWNAIPLSGRKRVFAVARDVTEHKDADRRLLLYRDRLRSLSSQVALIEDRQRRQLAAALHDGLAQNLFALRTKAALLNSAGRGPVPDGLVDEILAVLDQTLDETRSLTFELCPPVLYEVGLGAALAWLTTQFEKRTSVRCRLVESGEVNQLEPDVRAMVYQCVRELLANIQKHAAARWAEVTVVHEANRLTVQVDDDGRGFDPRAAVGDGPAEGQIDSEPGGYGLFSIRERLRSVDGQLQIDASPGDGCRITLQLPLATQQPDES